MTNEDNKSFKEKFREAMELPKELLQNYARITILGAEDVWIENYQGIMEYHENLIRFGNNISIYGNRLSVEEITREDILLVGEIKSIEFE